MKLCKDCKYYREDWLAAHHSICGHEKNRDCISGAFDYQCRTMRSWGGACSGGKLFEEGRGVRWWEFWK